MFEPPKPEDLPPLVGLNELLWQLRDVLVPPSVGYSYSVRSASESSEWEETLRTTSSSSSPTKYLSCTSELREYTLLDSLWEGIGANMDYAPLLV
jgi:hypothetical protein